MKQICEFERFDPPVLTEKMLRRELERRERRRQTVLLGLLCWDAAPILSVGCVCFAVVSAAGSGAITIVYTQKGGVRCAAVR